ncbi:MAG: Gfo/Idh/MocA family oxidoreductase [Dehalococcoidia bacterium]|nr:Gfo/Idh/MocA family oxidoreductase [Dehalococcoidia bacterium]
MTVNWGIIGPGGYADRMLAPAIRQSKDGKLVAIVSRDKGRAEAFAKGHGAEKGYDDLKEFLAHPGLDAVYVGTPNNLHAESVIPAAAAGKHCLVDFAMAVTEADCTAMIETCRKHNVKLATGHQTRYHPANKELKRLITDGVLGDIIMIRAQMDYTSPGADRRPQQWEINKTVAIDHSHGRHWVKDPDMRGGGAISSAGCFSIDLLRFLAGREVEEVFSYTDTSTAEHGQETYAITTLKFQRNLFAQVDYYYQFKMPAWTDNNVTVYGTKGRATSVGGLRVGNSEGAVEVVTGTGSWRTEYTGANMFVGMVDDFNQKIRNGGEPSPSGVDGWRERQVNLAVAQSGRQGTPVKIKL